MTYSEAFLLVPWHILSWPQYLTFQEIKKYTMKSKVIILYRMGAIMYLLYFALYIFKFPYLFLAYLLYILLNKNLYKSFYRRSEVELAGGEATCIHYNVSIRLGPVQFISAVFANKLVCICIHYGSPPVPLLCIRSFLVELNGGKPIDTVYEISSSLRGRQLQRFRSTVLFLF
jgi:hypothetical protein